jgi:hypothetical protein
MPISINFIDEDFKKIALFFEYNDYNVFIDVEYLEEEKNYSIQRETIPYKNYHIGSRIELSHSRNSKKKDNEDFEKFKEDFDKLIESNQNETLFNIIQNINVFLEKYSIPTINKENILDEYNDIENIRREMNRLKEIIDVFDSETENNPVKGGKKSRKRITKKRRNSSSLVFSQIIEK